MLYYTYWRYLELLKWVNINQRTTGKHPQCTNDWWTFVRTIYTLYIFCIYRYWEWIQSCFEFWEFTWTPNSFPSLREYLHSWSYIWAFWGCSMHRSIETYSTRSSPVFFWTRFHIQLPHHQTAVQFVFLNSALFASLSPPKQYFQYKTCLEYQLQHQAGMDFRTIQ